MYSNKIVYYIYIVIMSDIRFWNGNRVRRYIRNYFSKLETLSSINWFSYFPLISFSWWFYLLSLKVIIPFRNVWLILNAWIAYRFTDTFIVSTNFFQSYILTLGLHSSILRSINFLEDLPYFHIIITIINNSIFQQIHIKFSPLIINTHHRPQSHLSTPLPTSTRFISLSHFESISNFESSISNTLPLFQFPQLKFYFQSF